MKNRNSSADNSRSILSLNTFVNNITRKKPINDNILIMHNKTMDCDRKSDNKENSHPCVVLRNAEDLDRSNGKVKSKRLRDESIKKGKDVVVDLVDFSVAPNDNDIEEGKKNLSILHLRVFSGKIYFPAI